MKKMASDQDTAIESLIGIEASLQGYFHDELSRLSSDSRLDLGEDTLWYLTCLLESFSRSDRFFDFNPDCGTLTPLADYYAQAVDAETDYERRALLQRLGDVSIFVSGLFAKALDQRASGLDYYMAMGESAYACLADSPVRSTREEALSCIFYQLADQFGGLVELLGSLRYNNDARQYSAEFEFRSQPTPRKAFSNLILPADSLNVH